MKVSELQGALLDYWVAKAEGYELRHRNSKNMLINGVRITSPEYRSGWHVYKDNESVAVIPDPDSGKYGFTVIYSPSTNWSQGGPIIEREGISTTPVGPSWLANGRWKDVLCGGDSLLQSAMRCFVASVYGDEVPDDGW